MLDPIAPYSTAKGYIQSAHLMMSNPIRYTTPDDTPFYLAFHLICAFAVELYLKSYLIHSGHEDKELRGIGVRHNLEKLHELAKADDFTDIGTGALVDLLHEHHESFEFRYAKRETKYRAVNLQHMFIAFSALDLFVDAAVGASASKGLAPNGTWDFPTAKAQWRFIGVTTPG
jgi:hypothetical protein